MKIAAIRTLKFTFITFRHYCDEQVLYNQLDGHKAPIELQFLCLYALITYLKIYGK